MSDLECHSFSIVTPNYNMGGYLEETILSVIENLEPGDEYYIIDGGSTDSSVDIIKKYESHITRWISEPDKGYSDALFKGFNLSAAPLMCWINSGDVLLSGSLNIARKYFKSMNCDLLYCDDYYIDENGKVLQLSKGNVTNLKNMMLFGGWTPLQDACFWRRQLYARIGGINPNIQLAADFDLFLNMSMHGYCSYLPAVMSAFRRHNEQKSIHYSSEYINEKNKIINHALKLERCEGVCRMMKKLIYGFMVRLRYRIKCLYSRKTENLGGNIKQLNAEAY